MIGMKGALAESERFHKLAKLEKRPTFLPKVSPCPMLHACSLCRSYAQLLSFAALQPNTVHA